MPHLIDETLTDREKLIAAEALVRAVEKNLAREAEGLAQNQLVHRLKVCRGYILEAIGEL